MNIVSKWTMNYVSKKRRFFAVKALRKSADRRPASVVKPPLRGEPPCIRVPGRYSGMWREEYKHLIFDKTRKPAAGEAHRNVVILYNGRFFRVDICATVNKNGHLVTTAGRRIFITQRNVAPCKFKVLCLARQILSFFFPGHYWSCGCALKEPAPVFSFPYLGNIFVVHFLFVAFDRKPVYLITEELTLPRRACEFPQN